MKQKGQAGQGQKTSSMLKEGAAVAQGNLPLGLEALCVASWNLEGHHHHVVNMVCFDTADSAQDMLAVASCVGWSITLPSCSPLHPPHSHLTQVFCNEE